MKDKAALTILLVFALIIAPLSASTTIASPSFQAQVTGQANLGSTHSSVDLSLNGNFNQSTNTTGHLEVTITGSSDHTSLSGQGSVNLLAIAEGVPDFNIEIQGSGSFNGSNFSATGQISVYANLSGGENSTYMMESNPILPVQFPLPTNTTTSTMPYPTPPGPPTGNMSMTMILHLNVNAQSSGWMNGLNGHTETDASGGFNITNGAMMFGVPGDIVGTISYHSVTETVNGTSVKDASLNITFDSGNTSVDTHVAQTVYMFLNMMIGSSTNTNIDLSETSIIITYHSVSNITSPQLPQIPGGIGQIPGMGQMPGAGFTNVTVTPEINTTVVPLFYENASGQGSFSLSIVGNNSQSTIAVNGQFNGNVEGINPESLTFFPTSVHVSLDVNGENIQSTLHFEGDGDPSVPFEIAKTLLLTIDQDGCPDGVTVNVAMQTDGSVHFYNSATGEDLGTSLTVTCSNLMDLRHVIVAPAGTTVKPSKEGVLELEGENEVKLGVAPIMSINVLKVHSQKVEVNTGLVVISTPKKVHITTPEGKTVVVEIMENTMINGKLMMETISQNEANSVAQNLGYTAVGPGVKVEGIGEGSAKIQLPVSDTTGGVAVLEISGDGSTKLITNVVLTGNGTVVFTANSFSTFIPVATGAPGGGTTTTTQSTTTGAGGTTSETSSTTTTSTMHETTTTSTTQTGGGAGSQTTTAAGGTSMTLVAGVIVLLVIIGAAAYYIMRK